ncbi:MAG TPA: tRNA (adenosine(37)-N6)-dimethylallyltransferase MiaA [Chitinophagaceae bacterium]|nr:tRNA (adenosine(37)-N6)-dimethylallyltransferase MiaA [Chitinophagaceae bacterium]
MPAKTCIVITGPTAVGKTAYTIELALKLNTQIISADSRQCYKELNIGAAKPSDAQLNKVYHYFISSHSIHDEVNVKTFEEYALQAAEKIFETRDVAIMVGGTGLYVKAFCEGLDDVPPANESARKIINESYQDGGIAWLREEVKRKDPKFFAAGEMQNPQRMMRALEVKLTTGSSILDFHKGNKAARDFEIKKIHLNISREQLYERINHRVDAMMDQGLLKEAEGLFPFRHLNALQTVGYSELFEFIEGKISLDKAIDEIKKNTRHYAKRQITWFKKYNA